MEKEILEGSITAASQLCDKEEVNTCPTRQLEQNAPFEHAIWGTMEYFYTVSEHIQPSRQKERSFGYPFLQ